MTKRQAAQAHPPRIITFLRGPVIGVLGILCVPLIFGFPAFVYDLLFHMSLLLPNILYLYGSIFSHPLAIVFIAIVGGLIGFAAYSKEQNAWMAFQKRGDSPESDAILPAERRVEMPEPAAMPATQVVIGRHRTFWGVTVPILTLIWGTLTLFIGWSTVLFRWPPNIMLQQTILVTSIVFGALLATITWRKMIPRPTVFNDLGITRSDAKSKTLIPWSDVRRLLLIPTIIPEGKQVTYAVEQYRIVTDSDEPLEFWGVVDTGNAVTVLVARESNHVRAAITLAMRRTGLPLIADSEALQQRSGLLEPGRVRQARKQWYIKAGAVSAFLLILPIAAFATFSPKQNYHQISGTVASYKWAPKKITIRLAGDSTAYAFFPDTNSTWPQLPQTLAPETAVTLQVSGQDIGELDATTPSGKLHIVTIDYVEPLYEWLSTGVIVSFFLFWAVIMTVILGREYWSHRSGAAQAPAAAQ